MATNFAKATVFDIPGCLKLSEELISSLLSDCNEWRQIFLSHPQTDEWAHVEWQTPISVDTVKIHSNTGNFRVSGFRDSDLLNITY